MENIKYLEQFKKNIAPNLFEYEIVYKFFENGDFGTLNQIEFNSSKLGGNMDIWGLGWVGIFVWDYEKEEEVLNILLNEHQQDKQDEAFNKLDEILTALVRPNVG